jgi:citrate lyase subunit beta/citryl-CoA lyase
MRARSLLFVPADSPRKLDRAWSSGADIIVLDLEDAVAPSRKSEARASATAFINERAADAKNDRLFVRINPFDTKLALADLASVVVPGLSGIVLPKTRSAADVTLLSHYLDVLETKAAIDVGRTHIVPVATETAQAILSMATYSNFIPRLAGVLWGAEDLSVAVGALANREENGSLSPLYDLAGSLCLCAAAACGVQAIDTLYADFRDPEGLADSCRQSRRRGFRGRVAIHPDQVEVINSAFMPSEAELASARRVVAAFDSNPTAGAVSIDGLMYDIPHLKQARRTLGLQS